MSELEVWLMAACFMVVLCLGGWFAHQIGFIVGYWQGREEQLQSLLKMDLLKEKK